MKYYLECVNCGRRYSDKEMLYLCPECSGNDHDDKPPEGVLKVIYDYKEIQRKYPDHKQLYESEYLDILPINSLQSLSYLKVGNTPLYKLKISDNKYPQHELLFKDDSQNPTFSYKDRASNIVSAFAKEHGIRTIIAASTGNAGSSLAGIGASQQQQVIILVPENAPRGKLIQARMYGAKVIPVKGDYDMAFDLSVKLTEKLGIYNRNTAYNPFTIEGKKTAALEIFQQMGEKVPDRIFVPVGDGCIIAGIYKGWEDLKEIGYIDKLPQIVAVQADGSSNLISNLDDKESEFHTPHTVADSISVQIPRNFYMAKDFLVRYHGIGIGVSDDEIISSARILAGKYGLFAEPAAATAYAGYRKFLENIKVEEDSQNIVLLTGSGLKDIDTYNDKIENKVFSDIEEIENCLRKELRL